MGFIFVWRKMNSTEENSYGHKYISLLNMNLSCFRRKYIILRKNKAKRRVLKLMNTF